MNLLHGHDADVTHWVCERIPHLAIRIPYFERGQVLGPAVALGVVDETGIIAGVVFHGYDPFVKSIEVSCAATSPRWGNRETFRSLLRYAFDQCKVQRVTACTPRRATSSRRFLEGLGFQREGSIRRGFGDDNAILYGLLVEDWASGRFCAPRRVLTDEQEIQPSPAAGPRSEGHVAGAI